MTLLKVNKIRKYAAVRVWERIRLMNDRRSDWNKKIMFCVNFLHFSGLMDGVVRIMLNSTEDYVKFGRQQ